MTNAEKSARNELLQKFDVVNIHNVADKGEILQNLLDQNSDDIGKHTSYANIVRNKFKYLDETLYSKLVKKVLSHTLSSNLLKRIWYRRTGIFGEYYKHPKIIKKTLNYIRIRESSRCCDNEYNPDDKLKGHRILNYPNDFKYGKPRYDCIDCDKFSIVECSHGCGCYPRLNEATRCPFCLKLNDERTKLKKIINDSTLKINDAKRKLRELGESESESESESEIKKLRKDNDWLRDILSKSAIAL